MDLDERSTVHAALGDRNRLAMVDALSLGDRTFQELAQSSGLPGNLAAHHLDVLEAAGLIERRVSDGDRRRRYISLRAERLEGSAAPAARDGGSGPLRLHPQLGALAVRGRAAGSSGPGGRAESAGTEPAARVHPRP